MYMLWIRRSFQGAKIDLLEFDVSTLTAGDYTVEVKLEKEQYQKWFKENYEKNIQPTGISCALALKKQVRSEIEGIIVKERKRQDDNILAGRS